MTDSIKPQLGCNGLPFARENHTLFNSSRGIPGHEWIAEHEELPPDLQDWAVRFMDPLDEEMLRRAADPVICELEAVLTELVRRKYTLKKGSAEHAFVMRQITGLVASREDVAPIMEQLDPDQCWDHFEPPAATKPDLPGVSSPRLPMATPPFR